MKLKMYCTACDVEGEFDVPEGTESEVNSTQFSCPFCRAELEYEITEAEPALDLDESVDFGDVNELDES